MVNKNFENDFSVKYTRWVIANKWIVIALSLFLAMGLGSGGRFLGFTNNYRVFFGEDNPQLLAFEDVEDTYTKSDNLFFIVTPKSGAIFNAKTLAGVKELTKRSWQIPFSTRVDSITNFQHTRAVGDDLFVEDLVKGDPLKLSAQRLDDIKKIALHEPIIKNRLITEKANVTGVNVSVQIPGQDPSEVLKVNGFARELRDDFEKEFPDLDLRISGLIPLNTAFAELGQGDAMTLTPIMYLIMLTIMVFLLRSLGATFAALGVIILSTMGAMGVGGYLGILLTPPSAIAPTIILTLAIADSVHILLTMITMIRKGWSKTEALVESMRVNFQAVFLTSATTIVGFLCLNFSDAPPFHDLGNITSAGVLLAFIFSITFLPAIIEVLPIKVKKIESAKKTPFDNLGDFVIQYRKSILLASMAIMVALGSLIPTIDLNDQFIRWFDQRVEFRRDTDYLIKNLTGIYDFQYSLDSGETEGISEPEFMQTVEDFANWWRQQPEVVHVSTYTDILKKINQTMHGDDPSWYKLPNDLDLSSQYLLLYEMSLPFGLDLNNQMDIDKSQIKLTVTLKELTSTQGREVSKRGDLWLEAHAKKSLHAKATGPSVMFSHISERNINSMVTGTITAIILITLLMIFSLKSIRYGLISFLPNAMPAVLTFGLWAAMVNQVGMAISIVASATLGIIVDDSVHFLTKFLRAKRENGLSTADAIRYAFSNVGLALLMTSVILVIGFITMTYSSFLLNWSLGLMSAITIIFALLVDFFFLPAFLLLVDGHEEKPQLKSTEEVAT